ncbi:MAG: cyclic nucleotide-binding domain-containing protein [Candidatus Aureabacteria bacterium]|nr:cyclic nucleotide-binding domain-containing protein [Candidatus Auribacterota bacterium]
MSSPSISIEVLRHVPAFSKLAEDALQQVMRKLKKSEYKTDDILCSEGEKGDCMFIIESGEISVLKTHADGNLIEITLLKANDIAGEMGLFGEMVRSATLKARTRVVAWILNYSNFNELLEANSSIARGILSSITSRLHRETNMVAKLLGQDLDRRYKVAFFDSKPYMEETFTRNNPYNYSYRFFETKLTPDTVSLAAGCNAVCIFVNDRVDAEVLDNLHSMGINLIALRCAGFNNVDLNACKKRGVSVVRVPAYSPFAVAEHAVALMMTLNRRTHRANNRVKEGNFSLNGFVGFDVHGKTAGILGAGKIGRCTLSILAGFGCRLLVYDPFPDLSVEKNFNARFVDLDTLFAESDIISLHVPLTAENKHMINTAAISKMKKGVMLINTSRGALIDTTALLDGLKTGKIGYAGLDVYEGEGSYFFEDVSDKVLSDDTLARLLTFNNVIVTSHQAFLTTEALNNIAQTTVDNIHEFESGKTGTALKNHVTG